MKETVILTDVDGVLLNWEYAFAIWMEQHGFEKVQGGMLHYSLAKRYGLDEPQVKRLVKMFNESASIGFLPPLRDAIHYVKLLHERHGYIFHAITSLSLDSNAGKLRELNLSKLFGDTVFEKVVCLDTGADKDEELSKYKGTECFWIEDKTENALVGHELGLSSILVEHGHNMHFHHESIPVVKNWKHIHDIITGS